MALQLQTQSVFLYGSELFPLLGWNIVLLKEVQCTVPNLLFPALDHLLCLLSTTEEQLKWVGCCLPSQPDAGEVELVL